MNSSTSIPFYLWKNTCRRWLEHPVSPLSKTLVPVLLGLLSIIVLSSFAVVESDLRKRLAESPAYTVVVEEFVTPSDAPTRLQLSLEEEFMWRDRYGAQSFHAIRRPLLTGKWQGRQRIPVFVWSSEETRHDEQGLPVQVADPVFWDTNKARAGQLESVTVNQMVIAARAEPMPEWLRRDLRVNQALAVPVEMFITQLTNGFHNLMVLRLNSTGEVEQTVTELNAFYRAEGRNVMITSAIELLQNLERISSIQAVVRSLIVLGCGAILALILGSMAWLEYRQDAYLLALLKSFGCPTLTLLLHMLWENLLLVLLGLAIVWIGWPILYAGASGQMQEAGLTVIERPAISWGDHATILLSALLGCLLAMVPVAIGLRRKPGLILQ